MFKQKNGITLVALVITIIVLLVLAGVSINFMFGQEGIFTKSQYAVEKYKNAQEEENIIIGKLQEEIKSDRETVTLTTEEYIKFKSLLSVSGNVMKDRPDTWTVGVEYKWVDGQNEIYGQRYTGTTTINTSGAYVSTNADIVTWDCLVAEGGYFVANNQWNQHLPVPGRADLYFNIYDGVGELRLFSSTTYENVKYDVWILYTKKS